MLIGIDASRANRDIKSGTEWYSYYLILELAKIDRKNRYFLYTPDKLKGELAHLPENFREKVLHWPPKKLWTMLRLSFEMLKNPPDLLYVPAHIIPLISPKNTMAAIHDVGFMRYPKLYSQKELKYHHFGLHQAVKKAKKIITISEFSKSELINLCKVPAEKIEVIYLAFLDSQKTSSSDSETEKILEKNNISKNTPYILYIGRLEYKKNTPRLVSAFARFKKENPDLPHKLVLVGNIGVGGDEVLENIKKHHLEKEVIITKWVLREEMAVILRRANLFVFPSLYEGFGLPVLEALNAGVALCAANRTAIPEIAGGAADLFNPEKEAEIAVSMAKVLKNEDLRQELIAKGKQRVLAFSWRKCAEQTLKLFEDCQK